MSIINGSYQNTVFEQIILLRLASVENATYSISLTIVGINGQHGFGNWTASFQGVLNEIGCPLETAVPLLGSSTYKASGCPSISSYIGKLQINVTYPPATPLPTKPPTETNWKGPVTLTGGCVMGGLTRESGNITPTIYNVKAVYNRKFINGASTLFIQTMTIHGN